MATAKRPRQGSMRRRPATHEVQRVAHELRAGVARRHGRSVPAYATKIHGTAPAGVMSVRAKSNRHRKSTADKWNQ